MQKETLVSIIMPVYNSEKTIERSIKSVVEQKQKCKEIEFIVVDGASTDGTLDIVNKYSNYVDTLISEKDNGVYDAVNKGLRAASGKYFIMLAADDSLLNSSIESFLESVRQETDIWCGSIVYEYAHHVWARIDSDQDLGMLNVKCSLMHPATFFKKSIFDKIGYYNDEFKIGGDWEMFARAYDKGLIFQIERIPIVIMRRGGLSSENVATMYKEDMKMEIKCGVPEDKARRHYRKKVRTRWIYNLKVGVKIAMIRMHMFSILTNLKLVKAPIKPIYKNEIEKYGLKDF